MATNINFLIHEHNTFQQSYVYPLLTLESTPIQYKPIPFLLHAHGAHANNHACDSNGEGA